MSLITWLRQVLHHRHIVYRIIYGSLITFEITSVHYHLKKHLLHAIKNANVHFSICCHSFQIMVSLNINSTERILANYSSSIGAFDNRSMLMFFVLIISLFLPSLACTMFLLLHFGRLQFRH